MTLYLVRQIRQGIDERGFDEKRLALGKPMPNHLNDRFLSLIPDLMNSRGLLRLARLPLKIGFQSVGQQPLTCALPNVEGLPVTRINKDVYVVGTDALSDFGGKSSQSHSHLVPPVATIDAWRRPPAGLHSRNFTSPIRGGLAPCHTRPRSCRARSWPRVS